MISFSRGWGFCSEWQCIFWSGKSYFVVAMHILEWQHIFRSGNTYFGVAMHISEWQCIFRSGIHAKESTLNIGHDTVHRVRSSAHYPGFRI